MKRVLVAVDDSDASRRAATFVNYFFDGMDVEILAVNVAPAAAPWIPAGVIWGALYGGHMTTGRSNPKSSRRNRKRRESQNKLF
jgi:hypothetical protein